LNDPGARSYLKFTYEIIQQEYAEACRVQAQVRGDSGRVMRWVALGVTALGTLLLAETSGAGHWIAPLLLVGLGLFTLIYPTWSAYSAADRNWREASAKGLAQTLEADDGGIHVDGATLTVHYQWTAFDHFLETRSLFLIYQTRTSIALMVPRRALNDAGLLAAFRQLLERCIPPRTGGFPVIPRS
jgi:hypothetical protein